MDKLKLEADTLEALYLKDFLYNFDMGETMGNLAIVDVNNFTIMWSKFYQMISKSPKLRRVRLWDVVFGDEDNDGALKWLERNCPLWKPRASPRVQHVDEVVDLEPIALCFPQLSNLALSCDVRNDPLHYGPQGLSHLEKVILDLRWTVTNDKGSQHSKHSWKVQRLEK
ncbi:F-box/RNI-like superfamily protein [Actinidia rufa]|uniref:F-box/RNI-like superfamily protein n=1 Tax=Actinidia rufa TaxID=165716 RepID=A0A7J0H437_9ERIC|nr:F-box/RNI-like superfamily protein [Actinidia rufa]